ncbi:MAG TPA: SGNH/GDSL hydrolase family protein [Candidatus Sulfopaludibacter sp.]|nr:SGNH/GDSL hydrolase family protein [Candidatus Sulfopaludibacter sp.]
MRKFLPAILFTAALVASSNEIHAGTPPFSRESVEWCDIWISHANETNLPRVLLIGDSISRDYYPGVEKRLSGKAYVARLSTSAFVSDPVLLQEIRMVLGEYQFDVIHFNNGMHGWQHSETEYQKAFPKFLEAIQKYAPRAELVWATTTPLKVSPKLPPDNQTEATDERIAARNAIALKFVQAEGIPVDDLNALVRGHPEYHSDNVHFDSQGIDLEAAQVARQIEPLLKN